MEFTDLPAWIQTTVAVALYLLLLGGVMLLPVLFLIGVCNWIFHSEEDGNVLVMPDDDRPDDEDGVWRS